MSNIVTHERFNRPKVAQPCPRRRKGTISFRRAVADLQWKRIKERQVKFWARSPHTAEELRRLTFRERLRSELDDLPLLVRVPFDELDHVLQAGGLRRDVNLTYRCAVVIRDEDGPPAA